MPSIQDVADQINARLDQITTNTANTAQNTFDIRAELVQANGRLQQLDIRLAEGFSNLSQGLFALIQIQVAALNILDHQRRQNDTIICELVNANGLLCNIVRKLGQAVRLGEATLKSVTRLEGISARTHCCEAGDYDRQQELTAKIERCCPPEPVRPEECPQPCAAPLYREPPPPRLDWKPLPTLNRPDPIG
jgi:hypothetical protein